MGLGRFEGRAGAARHKVEDHRHVRPHLRSSPTAKALATFYDEKLVPFVVGFSLLSLLLWAGGWLAWHLFQLRGNWLAAVTGLALVSTCASFLYNVRYRNFIADQLPEGTQIPERRWSYGAADLASFKTIAAGIVLPDKRNLLQIYHGPVLLPNDLVFAVSMAAFVALLGRGLALTWPAFDVVFAASAVLGVLYGAADVAENMALAIVFGSRHVPSGAAGLAPWMTRAKIACLAASVTGGLLFLALEAIGRVMPSRMPSRF